jgi:hypothetical protein
MHDKPQAVLIIGPAGAGKTPPGDFIEKKGNLTSDSVIIFRVILYHITSAIPCMAALVNIRFL